MTSIRVQRDAHHDVGCVSHAALAVPVNVGEPAQAAGVSSRYPDLHRTGLTKDRSAAGHGMRPPRLLREGSVTGVDVWNTTAQSGNGLTVTEPKRPTRRRRIARGAMPGGRPVDAIARGLL